MLARLTRKLGRLDWKYFLTEILLLVIGINVGLWFNGRSERWRSIELEREVLEEMLTALQEDRRDMLDNQEIHAASLAACNRLLVPADSLRPGRAAEDLVAAWRYSYLQADRTPFEALENYGLRIVRDPRLRRDIVRLYNASYGKVRHAEAFHTRRTEKFEEVMTELFDFRNGRYVFRQDGPASITDYAYQIKGLQNSHYFVLRAYRTDAYPALDSLVMNLQDYLHR